MPFLKGGRHLWTHFSQSFFDKNEEFLCSSERKFPELFKTHPTFVYSPLLVPSMACQTQRGVFLGHPVCAVGPLSGSAVVVTCINSRKLDIRPIVQVTTYTGEKMNAVLSYKYDLCRPPQMNK